MEIINKKMIAIVMAILLLAGSVLGTTKTDLEDAKVEDTKNSQPKAQITEEPVIHLGTKLVTLTVTVTDNLGRLVTGLEKEHFEIFDNKVKQNIEYFSTEDAPISVALVFDRSGSMKERINRSLSSLRKFINSSKDSDEYSLVTFNNTAKLSSDFTRNAEELVSSLMMSETKGSTALFDAVYIGIEKAKLGRNAKKAVLILSDGQDNSSRYSLKELKKLCKEADVMIYSIGIVDRMSNDPLDLEGRWILEDLASITGGKAFFPSNDAEMQDAIIQIALEMRRQYSIGFSPNTNGDGKWHKLKIKVNPPKGLGSLSVRGREGYTARF
jgi:Ca-activated chloride channel homolog